MKGRFGGLTGDDFFLVPVPGAYLVVPVVSERPDCLVSEPAGCGSSGPFRPQPVLAKIISPAKRHTKCRRVARAIEDFQVSPSAGLITIAQQNRQTTGQTIGESSRIRVALSQERQ